MGKETIASINGFIFERDCERYHARGRVKTNKMAVVSAANLNESTKGVISKE